MGAAVGRADMQTFQHSTNGQIVEIVAGADTLTKTAIEGFLRTVGGDGVTTGQIIAAAAKLKMELGASKAYYDVISTLGDEMKRLISDAVK